MPFNIIFLSCLNIKVPPFKILNLISFPLHQFVIRLSMLDLPICFLFYSTSFSASFHSILDTSIQ